MRVNDPISVQCGHAADRKRGLRSPVSVGLFCGALLLMAAGPAGAQTIFEQFLNEVQRDLGNQRSSGQRQTIRLPAAYADSRYVRALQEDLTAAGYRPGAIDGRFGGNTLQAIQAWQRNNGYSANAVLDARQRSVLNSQADSARRLAAQRRDSQAAASVRYQITLDSLNKTAVRRIDIRCSSGQVRRLFQLEDRVWSADNVGVRADFHIAATQACRG